MNAARRKRLQEALDIIIEVKEEEQEAFDNLPESFQEGERGELMQEAIDTLDNIESELLELIGVDE